MEIINALREEGGFIEAVGILEDVQQKEKEKLEVTVRWQMMSQEDGALEMDGDGESQRADQRTATRKKYVKTGDPLP